MSGYNLCFSDLKSFRIHYFVEVPGDADRRKAFETIVLSRLRRDPRNENIIMTNFKSLEWVSKQSKAELRRQLISVLNQHADWKQLYSFSERGFKCVPQSVRGVARRVSPVDLRPQIGEESECKDDEERIVREKVFEMLEKADLERKERAKQKKINTMLKKARKLGRITRLQDQAFMDPVAEAIRRSVAGTDRDTRDARARRRRARR